MITLVERFESIVDGYYYNSEDYRILKAALVKQDILESLDNDITINILDLPDQEARRGALADLLKRYGIPVVEVD